MRAAIFPLLGAVIMCFQPGPAANVLENDVVRLEVSPENGSIIHLVDKRNGTDYINDPTQARLFRLLVPRPGNLSRRINSYEQKVESVKIADGTLKIHFLSLQTARKSESPAPGYPSGPPEALESEIAIDVTVNFRLEREHVVCGMQVANRTPEEITDVAFPWLAGLVNTSGGQAARLVLPSASQKVFTKSADILVAERAKSYPAYLATSWANFEFKDKGLGIEVQSPPETQELLVALNPGPLADTSPHALGPTGYPFLAWNFNPHIGGQSRWDSPTVILHVHDSDWHTIADEHREWYRQKFSPAPNGAFDRAIGFATYRLKRHDNTVNWTYEEIPKLAEDAALAGIHDLIIDGWREREGPGNPCPFGEIADARMGGGARLKSLIEKLRQQGVELAFSFHPTLIDTAAPQYRETGIRWTVRSRIQGNQLSPAYIFFSIDYPYEDYSAHYWAQIDPASAATEYLLKQAGRLRDEYGFRNLFLRGVGLQSMLSYNNEDAVSPQKVYMQGYDRLLGGLKKLFPQGRLYMEGFNDLVNGYSSAGYTWTQTENPEVLAWSIPWTPFSNDVEALNYEDANASFARKILINLIIDGGDGAVGRYPEFAKHLRSLQKLKEATAPYYGAAEFRDREGLKILQEDSAVVASVYANRDSKQKGVVLANLSKAGKKVTLELALEGMSRKGRLYRSTAQAEEISLSAGFSVELGPYEVVVLTIDPERARAGNSR